MELLFCVILAVMGVAIIFINLPGAKKRFSCLTYIKKPIMSKATRKKHQQPLAPRNTLNNYFAKADTAPKEPAKRIYNPPKQQSIGNAQTNGSLYPPSPADNFYQNDDFRYQGANTFADAQRMKNVQLEVDNGNSEYSHTNPIANLNKIKLTEHDDESTKKQFKKNVAVAIIDEVTKNHTQQLRIKHQNKQDQQIYMREREEYKQKQSNVKLELKVNKKVEEILAKQPLRNRFAAFLSDDLKYSIGFQHIRLLKLLRTVDCTLQFLRSNRQTSSKGIFLSQLRKILYENNRTEFSFKSLQQLTFIDSNLFQLQWLNNEKQKKIDLCLTITAIPSQDARIEEIRKKIVGFLLIKQAEYLVANNLKKQEDKWSGGFDPNLVQIPCKDLPPHPNMRNAQIGQLSQGEIDAVPNPRLRNIIQTVKQTSDARSLCSNDVVSMIFEKKTNTEIKDRLYEQIRLKQERNAVLAQAPVQIIDKKMALDVCTQIQMIYMAKGMTNIFRETLLDSLNKRLRFKQVAILQCFQLIMSHKQVQFLKQVTMSNKTVIIQINKEKFKAMREKIEGSL